MIIFTLFIKIASMISGLIIVIKTYLQSVPKLSKHNYTQQVLSKQTGHHEQIFTALSKSNTSTLITPQMMSNSNYVEQTNEHLDFKFWVSKIRNWPMKFAGTVWCHVLLKQKPWHHSSGHDTLISKFKSPDLELITDCVCKRLEHNGSASLSLRWWHWVWFREDLPESRSASSDWPLRGHRQHHIQWPLRRLFSHRWPW